MTDPWQWIGAGIGAAAVAFFVVVYFLPAKGRGKRGGGR